MSAATVFGPGQPDHACDLVVAAVVEEYLRRDPEARLNIRACGGKGMLFLAGEISTSADFDVSAVVKQTLAACGVLGAVEPFIAFEPMVAAGAKAVGSREPVTVQGYATNETPELLPAEVVLARKVARALEEKRTTDQDWFWLGADYEVTVSRVVGAKTLVFVRAEHIDTQPLDQARQRIHTICQALIPDAEIRVNPAGEETQAGLTHCIGSSGRNNVDMHAPTPLIASGVGLPLVHPRNLGPIVCRSIARRLVKAGQGQAVAVRATWLPLEMRSTLVRAWNEKNEDLSSHIQEHELDLLRVPPTWTEPHLVTRLLRRGTDLVSVLPWEM